MTAPAFFQEILEAVEAAHPLSRAAQGRRDHLEHTGRFMPAPITFEVVVGGGYSFGVALVRSISDAAEQFGDDSVEVAFARKHFNGRRADLVCFIDPIKVLDTGAKLDAMRQAAGLITLLADGDPIPPGTIDRLIAASHGKG